VLLAVCVSGERLQDCRPPPPTTNPNLRPSTPTDLAPTPGIAPTPGLDSSYAPAPTPGGHHMPAPTPGGHHMPAPTPSDGGYYTAPTPGGHLGGMGPAPTPGVAYTPGMVAPTPGGGGMVAPTPGLPDHDAGGGDELADYSGVLLALPDGKIGVGRGWVVPAQGPPVLEAAPLGGGALVTVDCPQLVRPQRQDVVKVVSGPTKGTQGRLISIEGSDAVLNDGTLAELSFVGKLAEQGGAA